MEPNEEIVTTIHPARKEGVAVPKALYDAIAEFIVNNIANNDAVTLADLLRRSEDHFEQRTNINWYIYHTKLDLEAKGLIKIIILDSLRDRVLKLSTSGIKYFSKKNHKGYGFKSS